MTISGLYFICAVAFIGNTIILFQLMNYMDKIKDLALNRK